MGFFVEERVPLVQVVEKTKVGWSGFVRRIPWPILARIHHIRSFMLAIARKLSSVEVQRNKLQQITHVETLDVRI